MNHDNLRAALWALLFKRVVKEMGWRYASYQKQEASRSGRELYRNTGDVVIR